MTQAAPSPKHQPNVLKGISGENGVENQVKSDGGNNTDDMVQMLCSLDCGYVVKAVRAWAVASVDIWRRRVVLFGLA